MNMPLQVECTLFFQENSYISETLDGVAIRLGKHPKEIKTAIDYLTSISILEIVREGEIDSYRYNQPDYYRMES